MNSLDRRIFHLLCLAKEELAFACEDTSGITRRSIIEAADYIQEACQLLADYENEELNFDD